MCGSGGHVSAPFARSGHPIGMMREPVAIVLNEREPAKLRAVEDLLIALTQHDITASRVPITQDIVAVIKQRSPKILVVDYLLGDYSTGLDILHALNSVKEERRPKVFFLTDEPSVTVAAEALRSGALNYFELDSADSIKRLSLEIQGLLTRQPTSGVARTHIRHSLDDLVCHSKAGRRCIEHGKAIALQHCPITVVTGAPGSGISAIAHAIELAGNRGAMVRSIDLRYHTDTIQECIGYPPQHEEQLTVGNNLSLIVEHADQDGGELLESIHKNFSRLWPSKLTSSLGAQLIVCSNQASLSSAWKRLLPIAEVSVPALDERSDDIPPLAMRFQREAEDLAGKKLKPLSSENMQWLSGLPWPGNIKQLRSCIIESLLLNMKSEQDLVDIIEDARQISELQQEEKTSLIPDALTAALIFDRNQSNYRITAAQLGVSIEVLQKTLRPQGVRS